MVIKAESVEQFSLEVIFPSSNYEVAMHELHRHVTAAEVLAEHCCLHPEHSSGKTSGEGDLMGSPMSWDHRHGAAPPCYCDICFFAICHSSERQTHRKNDILKARASKQ